MTWLWTRLALATAIVGGVSLSTVPCRADEPAPSATASEDAMAEARKYFSAGVNLLDDPDGARYEEAYHAFRRAYELSKSPKVLGNIGFCSLKLERDSEAIDAYSRYLKEAPDIEARERAQIERDLATLTSTSATVRVVVKRPAGSYVLTDTRIQSRGPAVVNAYAFEGTEVTLRVRAGRHSMRIKSGDEETPAQELTLDSAAKVTREFVFAPPVTAQPSPAKTEAPRRRPSYVGPIVLGAVGVAALGTGVVTGLMARGKTSDIEAKCPNDLCPASYDFRDDRSTAKTLGTIADISFIGGGVALGGALVWALLLPSSVPAAPKQGSLASLQPAAACHAAGCNVQIGGSF